MEKRSHNFKDLTGQKFGKLTVISLDRVENRICFWKCLCECGNITTVRRNNLGTSSNTCGCSKKNYIPPPPPNKLPDGQAALNKLYRRYQKDAEKKNRKFNIYIEDFKKLTSDECYYCGLEFSCTQNSDDNKAVYNYNGLDRIDNDGDYTLSNVVTCCKFCNYAKRNFTQQEFFNMIKRIYNKWHTKL